MIVLERHLLRDGMMRASFCAAFVVMTIAAPSGARADFVRGDCNADGALSANSADAVYLLDFLFVGEADPPCIDACDANDDGARDISDAIFMLLHVFLGGPAPPAPFPDCGVDPTPDDLPACGAVPPCAGGPVAEFVFDPLVDTAPARIDFDGRGSSAPGGTIAAWEWDFGDGGTGARSRLAHTFAEPGTYTVTLTVTDDAGEAASLSRDVVITEADHPARFDLLVRTIELEMRQLDAPGAAVAVIESGEVTFAAGFGSKHPERSDPVEATTLFRIGSVTKMMTAAGLLQLVERGQVDLDAPITTYLPEFSFSRDETWAPSITPRHLLTHSAGMADYLEINGSDANDDSEFAEFVFDVYGRHPFAYLMAPPGRMYNYSNPGFVLAGLVVERVSGTYYREYLASNLFASLGMNRTFFLPSRVVEDGDYAVGNLGEAGYALGWDQVAPDLVEPASYDNVWARPAGYAFSSVLDLAEFVKFVRGGRADVLGDEQRSAMRSPQIDMQLFLDKLHYGFGLMIQEAGFYRAGSNEFYEMRVVMHGGDIPGFAADLYFVPSLDLGFVCLANASVAHLSGSFLAAIQAVAELPAPVPLPDLDMDPAIDYPQFVGDYFDPYNVGAVQVRRSGDDLRVRIPVFEELGIPYDPVLLPNTPDNFVLLIGQSGLAVTFIRDASGDAEYFRTRSFVAARTEVGKRVAPARPELGASPRVDVLPAPLRTPFARPRAGFPGAP